MLDIFDNGQPMIDPTADQEKVVALLTPLAQAVWEVLSQQTEIPATSISAARAAVLAIEHIGVLRGFAMSVSAEAMNARMSLILEQKGRLPTSPKEGEHWFKNTGAHSVALAGKAPLKTKHSLTQNLGHMVVCFQVGDRWYMMDPSIVQASRPQKKLTLAALVVPVTERFVLGKEHGGLMRDDDGEGRKVLRYIPHLADDAFMQTPDWTNIEKDSDMMKSILTHYAQLRTAVKVAA